MSGTPPTRFPELHAFFARTEPRPTIGARSTPTTPPMRTSMPSSRRQRRTAARSDPAHPAMAALFSPGPSRTWAGSRTHRGMGHAERERRAIFLGTSRTGAATRPPISPAPRCPSRCLSRSRTSSAAASPPQEPGPHPRHHCLSPSRRRSYPRLLVRKTTQPPKWMGKLQTATPRFSFGLGFLLDVFPTDILTSWAVGTYLSNHGDPWGTCSRS